MWPNSWILLGFWCRQKWSNKKEEIGNRVRWKQGGREPMTYFIFSKVRVKVIFDKQVWIFGKRVEPLSSPILIMNDLHDFRDLILRRPHRVNYNGATTTTCDEPWCQEIELLLKLQA